MFAIIDHYAHHDSLLHRWHPVLKTLALLAAVVCIVSLREIGPLAAGTAACWALALATGIPARVVLRRQRVALMLFAIFLVVAWTTGGAQTYWLAGARWPGLPVEPTIVALRLALKVSAVLAMAIPLLATQPFFLFLESLRRLGLPSLATSMLLLMSRYNLAFADRMQNTMRAARLRGWSPGPSPQALRPMGGMIGSLVLGSLQQAERVEQAMRLRGFDGRIRVGWPYRVTAADVLKCVVVVCTGAGLIAWERWL